MSHLFKWHISPRFNNAMQQIAKLNQTRAISIPFMHNMCDKNENARVCAQFHSETHSTGVTGLHSRLRRSCNPVTQSCAFHCHFAHTHAFSLKSHVPVSAGPVKIHETPKFGLHCDDWWPTTWWCMAICSYSYDKISDMFSYHLWSFPRFRGHFPTKWPTRSHTISHHGTLWAGTCFYVPFLQPIQGSHHAQCFITVGEIEGWHRDNILLIINDLSVVCTYTYMYSYMYTHIHISIHIYIYALSWHGLI